MAPRDTLRIGQKLVIWRQGASKHDALTHHMMRKVIYKVRKGDSLNRIARKFKVSVKNLKKWNHIQSSTLRQGKTLTLYVDVADHH